MATALFDLTRRRFGQIVLGAGAAGLLSRHAYAQTPQEMPLHGLSAFGELRYPPGFSHFDYANPDAPSGGQINFAVPNWTLNQSVSNFDTLNTFVLRGNAPPRMETLYDGLMTGSLDEPDALYCALAESVTLSDDRKVFTFALRPEATFSTGEPVTAEDVAFSYLTMKERGHPSLAVALRHVDAAEAVDERTVRLTMNEAQTYQDALGALGVPVIPRAFFETRDLETLTGEVIPGSGRFAVERYDWNGFIEYRRRDDYWARDLGFARGLDHFEILRIDFFRDRQPALEAFKKGLIHFREEFTTKDWATEYRFPAASRGEVVTREFPGENRPRFQCWALNQRRERFADPRVRRAINLCFDFEWTNANLLFGLRIHSDSPFQSSEFVATGEPDAAELALLEPLRDEVPEEVFGPVWTQPVTDGTGRDRTILREAISLFSEAGWRFSSGQMQNEAGETFRLEFLTSGAEQERVYAKFMENLRAIGLDAGTRLVDGAQYQRRINEFDFDMILAAFSFGATPTPQGLGLFFGSEAADRSGAYNYAGMRSRAVDALIQKVGEATSREELVTTLKAMDRVLRWRLDWLPNISTDVHRAAYWDRFGFSPEKPDYGWPVESLWWNDPDKAPV